MSSLLADGAKVERLWTGAVWSEGPVWLPETRRLRWSDIHRNLILEYDEESGSTSVYQRDVEFTNGRTLDLEGKVLQCSHGRRAVEYDLDGQTTTVVDRWDGHRLNSPNDIVVASDGAVWFTDPPYGIFLPEEGHPGEMEYGGCWVFRWEPATRELCPMIMDIKRPNGLAFSPDETILYVSDTVDEERGSIRAYGVDPRTWAVGPGREFVEVIPGCADGFRIDDAGRIWTSSLDSVQVFTPDGEQVLRIPIPEKIGNLCFGGTDGSDLYVTASSSLYRIRTRVRSALHTRTVRR